MNGRALQLSHPGIAALSCDDCERKLYTPEGKPVIRYGIHQDRPKGVLTPCVSCPKFDRDTPVGLRNPTLGRQQELTERNRQAIRHYEECRAVGSFPDDDLVRRHAVILRACEDMEARARQRETVEAMLALVGATGAGRA